MSNLDEKMECGHLRRFATAGEVWPPHCLACELDAYKREANELRVKVAWQAQRILEMRQDTTQLRRDNAALAATVETMREALILASVIVRDATPHPDGGVKIREAAVAGRIERALEATNPAP